MDQLRAARFAVILLADRDFAVVQMVAERIRVKVQEKTGVTVSLGVSWATADSPLAELIGAADMALYQAKGSGRNRVVCAEQQHNTEDQHVRLP